MGILVPEIIGLPPSSSEPGLDGPMLNSLPQASIIPSVPNLTLSSSVFRVVSKMKEFLKDIGDLGYVYPNKQKVIVAFQADNFPSDSFTNEYGESFLENFTNKGAGAIGQLAQMTGNKQSLAAIAAGVKGLGAEVPGFSTTANVGAKVLEDMQKRVDSAASKGGFLGTVASGLNTALAGGRIDFPQIWKGSGFSPSYTMTVRLYNPNPDSVASTKKYIIGPLAVLLSLGLPKVSGGKNNKSAFMYNWPYFCKLTCPGIYFLNPCCINNITIIKGGDQQSISWNQRLNIVDVRMEFGSLFNTMVTGSDSSSRPTLKGYLEAMEGKKELVAIKRGKMTPDSKMKPKMKPHNTTSTPGGGEGVANLPYMPKGTYPSGVPPYERNDGSDGESAFTLDNSFDSILDSRMPADKNMVEGILTANDNQSKAFGSFSKGVLQSAKNLSKSPAEKLKDSINTINNYVGIYREATNIIGNVRTFDKQNILTSINSVQVGIDDFNRAVNHEEELKAIQFILGKSQALKRATDDLKDDTTEPETISV